MTYTNPFYNQKHKFSQSTFTDSDKPIEYGGYQIFQRNSNEFHIVKDGVCVGMNAGLNGAKRRIDTNEPKLYEPQAQTQI